MITRMVVSATAAAALGLSAASVLAAGSNTQQSADMQRCTDLQAQVTSLLPEAISQMAGKARSELDQGVKLCQQGKIEEGIATLEQARNDAMYRG